MALVCSNGALDFHKAEPLTFDYLESNKVDDHHVFPQAYLKKQGEDEAMNCVLNRTLIDKKTNIRISDKAPSRYLAEIEKEVGKDKLEKILASHILPSSELHGDDFESFMKERAKMLFERLKEQVGRDIPVAPVTYIEANDEIDDEGDDDRTNPREKFDPASINAHPAALLDGLPKETEELFIKFSKALSDKAPNVWFKSNQTKVVFWSPEKVFLSVRLSKSGLHFTTYTDGKALKDVSPIVQKDRGGELWGRIKLKRVEDVSRVVETLLESHQRLQTAIKEGRPTAWWAMTRKDRVA